VKTILLAEDEEPRLGMLGRWKIPVPIAVLFAMSVALIVAPIVDFWLGSPFTRLRHLIYLDGEMTLQAWYSSMQWFCAGLLFGVLTLHAYRSRLRGLVAAGAFTLACIAFSIDEIAGIHEWLGQKSDALLPSGTRQQTALARTGIWPILLGVPVLAALAIIVLRMRYLFLPASPRALRLLTTGLVIMFTGALAIELGANLIEKIPENRGLNLAQLAVEEFMEMLGVSFIVWSVYELLRAHGVALKMPASMRPLPGSAAEPATPQKRPDLPGRYT
jgi:hypothetical protein